MASKAEAEGRVEARVMGAVSVKGKGGGGS